MIHRDQARGDRGEEMHPSSAVLRVPRQGSDLASMSWALLIREAFWALSRLPRGANGGGGASRGSGESHWHAADERGLVPGPGTALTPSGPATATHAHSLGKQSHPEGLGTAPPFPSRLVSARQKVFKRVVTAKFLFPRICLKVSWPYLCLF